jgi:phosphoribosylformylglycinamidine synthase
VNDEGNVVGLMPHPDRASDPALGNTDGLGFFTSGVAERRTGGLADVR